MQEDNKDFTIARAKSEKISRFSYLSHDSLEMLPDDVRERIIGVQEKTGFIPNVFLALARRPDEFRAFFAYHDALMEKKSGLSKVEREMIVVTTSALNHCLYCVVAHGAILRVRSKNPKISEQIAINYRRADIIDRQKAILDYAYKVAIQSHEITQEDVERLYAYGLDDEDIWDIGAIVAFFAMSNRLANMAAIQPNGEFYMMGRFLGEV